MSSVAIRHRRFFRIWFLSHNMWLRRCKGRYCDFFPSRGSGQFREVEDVWGNNSGWAILSRWQFHVECIWICWIRVNRSRDSDDSNIVEITADFCRLTWKSDWVTPGIMILLLSSGKFFDVFVVKVRGDESGDFQWKLKLMIHKQIGELSSLK